MDVRPPLDLGLTLGCAMEFSYIAFTLSVFYFSLRWVLVDAGTVTRSSMNEPLMLAIIESMRVVGKIYVPLPACTSNFLNIQYGRRAASLPKSLSTHSYSEDINLPLSPRGKFRRNPQPSSKRSL